MSARPAFLRAEHAAAFQDPEVAALYDTRPPYPAAVFQLLDDLLVDQPRVTLDLGCGTGFLARRLAPHIDRVDALDVSAPMIDAGRRAPGGDHPAIRWIVGRAEEAPLRGPYAQIVAGTSLHWMAWDTLLPGLATVLTPRGRLVIVNEGLVPPPWRDALIEIIKRYSVNQDYLPDFNLPAELAGRGLFELEGRVRTTAEPFQQSLTSYVESFHARSSLARARLGEKAASRFDAEVRALVHREQGETVQLQLVADVAWGRPIATAP